MLNVLIFFAAVLLLVIIFIPNSEFSLELCLGVIFLGYLVFIQSSPIPPRPWELWVCAGGTAVTFGSWLYQLIMRMRENEQKDHGDSGE
jgi:hypothetical protein